MGIARKITGFLKARKKLKRVSAALRSSGLGGGKGPRKNFVSGFVNKARGKASSVKKSASDFAKKNPRSVKAAAGVGAAGAIGAGGFAFSRRRSRKKSRRR